MRESATVVLTDKIPTVNPRTYGSQSLLPAIDIICQCKSEIIIKRVVHWSEVAISIDPTEGDNCNLLGQL